ncbi:Tryptophan aminotransferase-related protein 4 [Linum perenne]
MGKSNAENNGAIISSSNKYIRCLVVSILLNFSLLCYNLRSGSELSWSQRAAAEAEEVAAVSCSGHGRAYLDGVVAAAGGLPECECNACYGGSDCSLFDPDCSADADSGNPLFLEPFWIQRAAASAVLIAGHHRMSYFYGDFTPMSSELERHIRKLHYIVGNAVTDNKFILFGVGSTQLLNAAVHAFSTTGAVAAAGVVASPPFYPVYELQTEFFNSKDFQYQGDATTLLRNKSRNPDGNRIIEFVTSPNNPDGKLNRAVLEGPNFKAIHDRAYFWPHFTPIPAPDNSELAIFTLSKLTGHAGSRFGWAIVKDEEVYSKMAMYLKLNTMGDSRESQLRALTLLKTVVGGEVSGEGSIFEFGYRTMKKRWEKLRRVLSGSKRFSVQEVSSQYCRFFGRERKASPAYAWLKCEAEDDRNSSCYDVLKHGGILGRDGPKFSASDRYVRLSLIKTEDDFNMLLQKFSNLISSEIKPEDDVHMVNDVASTRPRVFELDVKAKVW